jgi:uncharacterized membrane protein
MKKILIVSFILFGLTSCIDDTIIEQPITEIKKELVIQNPVGIKLETPFVTTEVAMNVKVDTDQQVTIKIFDISNRVVSKETMNVTAGDNILKVYTTTLPSSAYRIALFDVKNNQLGIVDFNKI